MCRVGKKKRYVPTSKGDNKLSKFFNEVIFTTKENLTQFFITWILIKFTSFKSTDLNVKVQAVSLLS